MPLFLCFSTIFFHIYVSLARVSLPLHSEQCIVYTVLRFNKYTDTALGFWTHIESLASI